MTASEPEGKKARVFLVDDHAVVREGLRGLIEQEHDLTICGESGDAADALSRIQATRPDLVLLDLSLRQGSGMELLKDLAIQDPSVPVLVLSMHDEMIYAERALRAGARGYVMKGSTSQQVITAIRRVLSGKVFISDGVMSSIATKLGRPKSDRPPIHRLSDRELQVFEFLGQGLSTSQIAERMHLSVKTVQVYFARLKEKFGVTGAKELLREAFRWNETGVT
ncbi:MAG: DNA-binding response regulator [Verrucomicrobia bacterium]|jgi:DNA-binding NarL/FixJ family response regulator|nr:MAG: DNA-binding response regulator [Verrucomicrobiota bacterium]